MEAGKLSASSLELQPYRMLVVQSPEMLEKLTPALLNPSQVSTCSHLIIIISKKRIEDGYVDNYFSHISGVREIPVENLAPFRNSINYFRGLHNEDETVTWNEKQGYLLLGNLMFASALEKVDTCPMEGFLPDKISEILGLNPEIEKPSVTLALG